MILYPQKLYCLLTQLLSGEAASSRTNGHAEIDQKNCVETETLILATHPCNVQMSLSPDG